MKLIQFADFHLRLSPAPQSQFHVQPFWRGESREMFSRITKAAQGADAVLFTGDAAHGGGRQEVAKFFDLLVDAIGEKPIFMVLGNHDVAHPDWEDHFRRGIEPHKNIRLQDGVCPLGEVDIALINNEYLSRGGDISSSWHDDFFPIPAMSAPRAAKLNTALSASKDRPAIAMVHCPSHVLPATVYDFSNGVFAGMDRYREVLHGVLDNHPRVGLVLCGHVHFNSTQICNGGRVHQSLASTTEYPFQVRIIEISGKKCQSRLAALARETDAEEAFEFGGG